MGNRKLYRTEGRDSMLAGVCGGFAEFFGIDPSVVRVIWAFLFFFGTAGFWLYLICAFVLPKKSDVYPGF